MKDHDRDARGSKHDYRSSRDHGRGDRDKDYDKKHGYHRDDDRRKDRDSRDDKKYSREWEDGAGVKSERERSASVYKEDAKRDAYDDRLHDERAEKVGMPTLFPRTRTN